MGLRAYRQRAGIDATTTDAFGRRCRACAVARLLQTALEEMRRHDPQATTAPRAGSLARSLVTRSLALAADLNGVDELDTPV